MPAHSSVAKARQGTPYRRLATKGGEICGLAGGVPGVFPFHRSHEYPCQTTKNLALPAALSGFRLTPPADPMRAYARSLGSTGPAYLPSPMRWHIQYSRLLKSVELPNRGSQGVGAINAKNPGGACRHQPGFPGDPREAPDVQVTSRI